MEDMPLPLRRIEMTLPQTMEHTYASVIAVSTTKVRLLYGTSHIVW